LGEIHVGFADTVAMTPEGAALPSWRVSVVPPAQSPPCTGGNPRISPDSSGVIVVLLVEGVVWYAVVRSARSVVGLFREAQRLRVVFVLVDLPVLPFFFFFFFLC
jgi:hypothetical protein